MEGSIIIKGARTHNLKNIDLELARNRLIVITGVSGSGKSSLAFDTLYAEGQRRYVESLSAYARQFLDKMEKPDVDFIEGIPPAIAIQQTAPSQSSRSTVGTSTEIYDYLRLLFARIGKTYCHGCGRVVEKDTIEKVVEAMGKLPPQSKLMITFPYDMPGQALSAREELRDLLKRGFTRAMLEGEVRELDTIDADEWGRAQDKEIVVDRFILDQVSQKRLVDSLETAYQEGQGLLCLHPLGQEPLKFSLKLHCPYCSIEYEPPFPLLFSFNSPMGACPKCNGFGNLLELDMDLVVPDKRKSINQGAIKPWTIPSASWVLQELRFIAPKYGLDFNTPFKDLKPPHLRLIMEGEEYFPGIKGFFEMIEKKKYMVEVRVFLSRYRSATPCPLCHGSRLRQETMRVKVHGLTIADITRMKIKEAYDYFSSLTLTEQEKLICDILFKEIRSRLEFMLNVGLDYLTLDRLSKTLSGGEAQRIKLASCLGSSLTNTLYVLDEPSIGLHPRDNAKLIYILKRLRDLGNTIVVVEHDRDMIMASDEIVDLGPGAGQMGGRVVFQGSFEEIMQNGACLTGQYLRGEKRIAMPLMRRMPKDRWVLLKGAREHNLKNIDVAFPLGLLVCITGVSGSGKSTLIHDVLYHALERKKEGLVEEKGQPWDSLEGSQHIKEVVMVDQSPIGRTPRSNPVTYVGAFSDIRALFASTSQARLKGYHAGSFSFNVAGERCEKCKGAGAIKVEMQFFADVFIPCEECEGTRYKASLLEIKYKGKNIHQVLEMTVDEAYGFFTRPAPLVKKLKVLQDTGLGYLKLGQPASTLSGGEAQRLKLSAYIAQARARSSLFIFDEPTTGLHFDDIKKLLNCFEKLIEMGNSVIVIEHNLDVIKGADYIIDLGPEGGDEGGSVVATGTPEELMNCPASYTGHHLRRHLEELFPQMEPAASEA